MTVFSVSRSVVVSPLRFRFTSGSLRFASYFPFRFARSFVSLRELYAYRLAVKRSRNALLPPPFAATSRGRILEIMRLEANCDDSDNSESSTFGLEIWKFGNVRLQSYERRRVREYLSRYSTIQIDK